MNSETTKTTASDVARYILDKKGSLTGFQIQKLLFYCQAWSLVINKCELFEEDIRAFEHGPAVQSVSRQHQGRRTVYPSMISGNPAQLTEDSAAIVDKVVEYYGMLSGDELEALSHSEQPWLESYNGASGRDAGIITKNSIADYYSRLLTTDLSEQAAHHVPVFDHPKTLYVSDSDYRWLLDFLDADD